MLSRRKLLKGLIAAPLVITTPGLLMPVKAVPAAPEFGMFVKGQWIDGSAFSIGVEHGYSAADIGGMDWFDSVARIDSVEYTQEPMKQLVTNQEVLFDPYRRVDRAFGKPMVPYHMRPESEKRVYYTRKELRDQGKRNPFDVQTISELKKQGFMKTPPEWQ